MMRVGIQDKSTPDVLARSTLTEPVSQSDSIRVFPVARNTQPKRCESSIKRVINGYTRRVSPKIEINKTEQPEPVRYFCHICLTPKPTSERMQTYVKSPQHRKDRLNTYHRDTYFTKKERLVT